MNLHTFEILEQSIKSIPEHILNVPTHTFTFNRMYRVYMSEESRKNIPKVFGASLWWRWKKYGKKIRKKNTLPHTIELSLPSDSIIFVRPEKDGIIALSYDQNLNVKVILNKDFLNMLEHEVNALSSLKGMSFAPQVIASSLKDHYWLITDCSLNTDPLLKLKDPEQFLLNNFQNLLLPHLDQLYKSSHIKSESVTEWLARVEKRVHFHPEKEMLMKGVAKIRDFGWDDAKILISSLIHFDLHPGNILRHQDKLTIVDWEGGVKSLVLMDFFYMTKRVAKLNRKNRSEFIKFILGESSRYPNLEEMQASYMKWVEQNFEVKTESLAPQLFALISLVEQVLILWEERNFDTLSEYNGFEREIFTSI